MHHSSDNQKTKRRPVEAIVLAAGKGVRMGSDLPKVLHPAADHPMVWWVVRACRQAGARRCVVVVGVGSDQVREALANEPDVEFVEQTERLGTGHAALMAAPLFANRPPVDVLVLAGDGPLIRAETLKTLLTTHRESGAAATLATAVINDPTGNGRIARNASGRFEAIVEHKDASVEQLAIREINPSYYCFQSELLFQTLPLVRNTNNKGEYYLTDVPAMLKSKGHEVALVDAMPAEDVLSVNTPTELAVVDRILRERLQKEERGAACQMGKST